MVNISLNAGIGLLALFCLVLTIVFGMLLKKGRKFFVLHRIFSILTIIAALIHFGLALRWYF